MRRFLRCIYFSWPIPKLNKESALVRKAKRLRTKAIWASMNLCLLKIKILEMNRKRSMLKINMILYSRTVKCQTCTPTTTTNQIKLKTCNNFNTNKIGSLSCLPTISFYRIKIRSRRRRWVLTVFIRETVVWIDNIYLSIC